MELPDVPEEQRLPECPEKSRLMDEYSAAISEFSRVANIVNARMGVMYKGDYERLTKVMTDARVLSDKVYQDLLAHIASHGC